jgi:hypothetical protein
MEALRRLCLDLGNERKIGVQTCWLGELYMLHGTLIFGVLWSEEHISILQERCKLSCHDLPRAYIHTE